MTGPVGPFLVGEDLVPQRVPPIGGGWFVGTVPIMTANWNSGGEKWTLPVGIQAGRVIKLGGKLPVKLQAGAYYNALRPPGAGTWQLLTQVALVF